MLFMTRIIFCLLTMAMPLALSGTARAKDLSPPPQPNILLILADDLGFSDMGCYGGEVSTPNLDALAAHGLRFKQFYNCTRCCPTRASLLTGLYPHQAGVGLMTRDTKQPGYRGHPQPNTVTIAEVLKSAGYHTSMVGKWHLSVGDKSPQPTDRGFDEFYGMIGGYNSFFNEPPFYSRLPVDRKQRLFPAAEFYATDAFADYAIDFVALARQQKKPFFQYLAFNAPHFPLQAKPVDIANYSSVYAVGWDAIRAQRLAQQIAIGLFPEGTQLTPLSEYKHVFAKDRQGVNPRWSTLAADRQADLARRMAIYAGMVACMDRAIGRLVDNLRSNGELDNTLIFFLSDNGACAEWDPFGFDTDSGPNNVLHTGAMLKQMGGPKTYHSYGSGWANACNTPLRMYKHDCHEGGIRTPLIVHWPKQITAQNAYRDQVGHVIDIMATCVAVSGARYPQARFQQPITPLEGQSLLPAFANRPIHRDYLAWEHEHNRAIRVGDWKLLSRANEPWQLYDLKIDSTEMHDLAGLMADKVTELSAIWQTWAQRTNVFPRP